MKGTSELNPKTKRAIVALSIIALLILLAGMVSCSVQLSRQDTAPPISGVTDTPKPDPDREIVADIDRGGVSQPEGGDTQEDGGGALPQGESGTSDGKPAAPGKKPAPTPKPADPTPKPTNPPKPVEPTPKPTDPPKPETKPEDKPDRPGSGSGSGGSSVSYPAAVVEMIAPDFSHADTEFEVKTTLRNVKSLEWAVTEDGKDTPQGDFLKGTLDKNGGKITITKPGIYLLTAAAKNYGGHTYTFSKKITIHPTFEISVTAEQYAHTDKAFEVSTTLSGNVAQQLNWHIYKDGNEVKWQDTVTGILTNGDGSIQIKEKGRYTLKATAFDETSREFSGKAEIAVLPVVKINVTAPKTAHTDTPAALSVSTEELGNLPLVWSVAKDGREAVFSDCIEGKPDNTGGAVRFREKGEYTLTAAAADPSGRMFSGTADTKVYPVAAFSFDLPATTHTDTPVKIAVKSSDLQNMTADWTVFYNGKIVAPAAVLDGRLTNEGGTVRFTKKGSYILKATLTDETGREYSHEASTVAYPVAEAGFYLPTMTHTDTTVEVKSSFKEAEGLTAEWSLTKDGRPMALADGFDGALTNEGGGIRFYAVGSYELKAAVTDSTGRSFTYTSPCTVYPVISLSMELTKGTHTDKPAAATLKTENAGALPVVWSMEKNGAAAAPEHSLTASGGMILFDEKGDYTVTAAITDEAGRTFSASQPIKVYPIPNIAFAIPTAVHTDDSVTVNTAPTDMEGLTAVWYVDNTLGFQDWDTYVSGKLSNGGGSIRFLRAGIYDLQARVTDATGRVFRFNSGKIEVLPVLTLSFDLPAAGYTDTQFDVRTRGNNNVLPIEWQLMKNGQPVALDQATTGSLNAQGGKIRFAGAGEYRLTATMFDALGRVFSHTESISIYPLYNCAFSMPSAIHTGRDFVVAMDGGVNLGGKTITWTAAKDGQPTSVSGSFKGSLTSSGGTVRIDTVGSYTLTATITDELGRAFTHSQNITAANAAPAQPTITANVTRTQQDGKFLVTLTANSSDPDGDAVTYEYEGKAADNYYSVGTYTVRVRAKDNYGGVSAWAQTGFTITNSAPTRPVITRTPNGNSIAPGTPVTITASSTDADGDAITYVWEGRPTETAVYALGKHTIRVKAVDSTGAESPWAAIVFFVMDANGSGGMMLTGPDSTINENGIEGATISSYTFTVPPVSGHNGQDYGRVRGYNIKTGAWDQLDYGTTNNGITFTRNLTHGVYSKLEFYYYTNHNCMYNKSNITYTVAYYFE